MSAIKNVAISGASGSLGSVIFEKLLASGKFNINILRRQGSSSTLPSGAEAVDVDFDSVESLTAALAGQDAVISATSSATIASQQNLVEAAAAAGVKRFLPSDFGSNLDNPNARKLPVYAHKVQIQEALIEKAKTTGITYTFVYNSAFLDWGLEKSFLLNVSEYKPTIVDGGDAVFSATTTSSIGDAVVGILTHPEETKNRSVHIEDIKISQNHLLALAKQLAPERPWQVDNMSSDEAVAEADAKLAKGILDGGRTFIPYLYKSIFGGPAYGASYETTDNELLGVKGKTEKDVVEILKTLVK